MSDTDAGGGVPVRGITVTHRQRTVAYDRSRIDAMAKAALPLCSAVAHRLGGPLAALSAIDVSIVGTRAMARVHRDFLNVAGATDVITFPYGEILVCAPVAASRAEEFRHSLTDEIAVYIIHGLLHLAGHDDIRTADASRMAREQDKILQMTIKLLSCACAERTPSRDNRKQPV